MGEYRISPPNSRIYQHPKTQLPSYEGSCVLFNCRLRFDRLGDHILEQDFDRHGMGTTVMSYKKFAIASKRAVVEGDLMIIVIAMKCDIEFIEEEAVALLCVPFGFLPFADHSIVHRSISFQNLE